MVRGLFIRKIAKTILITFLDELEVWILIFWQQSSIIFLCVVFNYIFLSSSSKCLFWGICQRLCSNPRQGLLVVFESPKIIPLNITLALAYVFSMSWNVVFSFKNCFLVLFYVGFYCYFYSFPHVLFTVRTRNHVNTWCWLLVDRWLAFLT